MWSCPKCHNNWSFLRQSPRGPQLWLPVSLLVLFWTLCGALRGIPKSQMQKI